MTNVAAPFNATANTKHCLQPSDMGPQCNAKLMDRPVFMNAITQQDHRATSTDDEVDLGKLFATLWRGKFTIVFAAFLATLLGGYYAFAVATPYFTTTASVVQETDNEPVIDFSAPLGGGGLGGGSDQSAINTEIEVLKSRGLLEKIVAELGLQDDPEFNAALRPEPTISIGRAIMLVRDMIGLAPAPKQVLTPQQTLDGVVDELRNALSISNIRQSYVFNLMAETQSAEKSALIANTLAENYIANQLDVKSEANARAMEWLTDRVGDLRIELEIAETAVKDFNAATDLINEETLAALNRQVKELRERLDEERVAAGELAARIMLLKSAGTDPQQMALLAQDRILDRLLPPLINDPAADRSEFDARFAQIISQAELEENRLRRQITSLGISIGQQEEAADQQSDDLLTLQQLQREAGASGLLYEFFLSRLKETSVQSGIQEAESRVLSRAVVPLKPSAPRKTIILATSLVLGALLGIGLVLLRELRQSTFRAAEELEAHTGMTVLGQIPLIPGGRRAKVLKYLSEKPTSAAAEAVRNLRTSVLLADPNKPPKVIMSTSSVPGEGKTTQSLGLAQNLAGLNKKVLLIEGDIRKLIFAKYFNIKTTKGLSSVLNGEVTIEEAAVFEPSLNAHVLIGEKSNINAADLFSSDDFHRFLTDMRAVYDYIIIDTPPVLAVPDARVIGRVVDAVIYTVRWDSTTQRQVTEGLKSLRSVGVKVTGLVLGQVNPKGQRKYGYGDGAGGYDSYHNN